MDSVAEMLSIGINFLGMFQGSIFIVAGSVLAVLVVAVVLLVTE